MENGKNKLTATVTMDAMEYVDMVNYIRDLEKTVRQQSDMIKELRTTPQTPDEGKPNIIKTRPTKEDSK